LPHLESARLKLIPLTYELVKAAVTEPAETGRLLGATVAPGWPGPDYAEVLATKLMAWEQYGAPEDWGGLVLHKGDNRIIGDAGFHGAADPTGTVEIGYSIAPDYRRQGYASEIARALVDWALARPEVRRVIARIEPENLPSIRVAERLGMRLVATHEMLEWELCR